MCGPRRPALKASNLGNPISSVPDFLIQNLRDLRVLRGEIEDRFAGTPLQRTRSDGQAFKRGRRGHRSPIHAIRVVCSPRSNLVRRRMV